MPAEIDNKKLDKSRLASIPAIEEGRADLDDTTGLVCTADGYWPVYIG